MNALLGYRGESQCQFDEVVPGTEEISGPFPDATRARTEWQRLTFRDRCGATTRYSIAVEHSPR